MSYLLTAAQMRALEARAVEDGGSWDGLMVEASGGMAAVIKAALGDAAGKRAVVLVGPGNNGGDGLVIARMLAEAGAQVGLYLYKRAPEPGQWQWAGLEELGVRWAAADDGAGAALAELLGAADIIVDALLGIGVNRMVAPELAAIIEAANRAAAPIVAVDIASGVDTDTGKIWGTAIKADITVAAGHLKRGHRLYPGAAYSGALRIAPLSLPEDMETRVNTIELNDERLRALLPERPEDGHKDTFGRVMVVAGSYFYPGAAWLAGAGALRSGAGVVTIACPRSIYGATSAGLHEATYLPLPEGEPGALAADAARVIRKHLSAKHLALVIGPGLGQEDETGEALATLLGLEAPKRRGIVGFLPTAKGDEHATRRKGGLGFGPRSQQAEAGEETSAEGALPALVLDADALNLLAKASGWEEHFREHPTVFTPHPGEMKRLLGVETLGDDPVATAAEAAERWGVVVVLKDAHTVIAAPDGRVAVLGSANSVLARGGSGDVLAGLIGGLLAQGLAPFEAAQLAVGVHSLAAAEARRANGSRGAVVGDVVAALPAAWRTLEEA